MLPKSKRLDTKQFNEIISKGNKILSNFFIVRYQKGFKTTQIAVVCPYKVCKLAVKRNKNRRVVYNQIAKIKDVPQGVHVIFITKKDLSDEKSENIKKDTNNVFVKML